MERRGRQEDDSVEASRLERPKAPSKARSYDRKEEREHSRSGSEAGSVERTGRDGGNQTPPSPSPTRPENAASPGPDEPDKSRRQSNADADGEPVALRNLAKSASYKPGRGAPVGQKKRGLERDKSQNSIRSDRGVPAAASAVAGKKARPRQDEDKRSPASDSPANAAGKKGSSPASLPKHSEASPTTPKGEGDEEAADEKPEPQLIGGWLNILRGTAPAPLDVPQSEAGTPGPRVGRQKAVPAKSDLKVERDPQLPGEAVHSRQHSRSQSSSYVQPYDTPLSVHTRDLESESLLGEDDGGTDVEEAEGWWWWCTWSNAWLGAVVFSIVVVLPLILLLMGQKGQVYPRERPENDTQTSDSWDIVTPHKPRAPMIPLEDAYNEDETGLLPACTYAEIAPSDASLTMPPEPSTTTTSTFKPQYRPVICVVDAMYIFSRQSSNGFHYSLKAIPNRYCTAMVYYSVGISHGYHAQYKLDRNRAKDALEELVYSARRSHRNQSIPVYLTVGGSRNDSTGISEALKANMLHTSIELLPGAQGVQECLKPVNE
ncbi:uncharacterized protein LOC144109642 [Amblyomma americanum]